MSSNSQFIHTVSANDVILGRGLGPREYRGNKQFLNLVGEFKAYYTSLDLSEREEKNRIARRIVDHIRQSLHGRFLKQVDPSVASRMGGGRLWVEVDYETALEKTKQALRQKDKRSNTLTDQQVDGEVSKDVAAILASQIEGHQQQQQQQQQQNFRGEEVASHPPLHSNLASSVSSSEARLPVVPTTNVLRPHISAQQPQSALLQRQSLVTTRADALVLLHNQVSSQAQPPGPAVPSDVLPPPTDIAATNMAAYHTQLALFQMQQHQPQSIGCSTTGVDPILLGRPSCAQAMPDQPPNGWRGLQLLPGSFGFGHQAVGALQDFASRQWRDICQSLGGKHNNDAHAKHSPRAKRQREDTTRGQDVTVHASNGSPSTAECKEHDPHPRTAEELMDAAEFLMNALELDPEAPRWTKEQEKQERALLTPEEQGAALADVFGNLCEIDPSFKRVKRPIQERYVESLLKGMRLEIENLPVKKKSALLEAHLKSSAAEFSDKRMELFLQREEMNPRMAAQRFVLYWEKRREWFGPEKFHLPMTESGAFRDDQAALNSGVLGLLPDLDASGRQIMYAETRLNSWDGYDWESLLRAHWYVIEAASEHPNAAKGVVVLIWSGGSTLFNHDRKARAATTMYELEREAWPVHFCSGHCCVQPTWVDRYLKPVIFAKLDKRFRSRVVYHDANQSSIVEVLRDYGMSEDVIPAAMGGKSKYNQPEWLAKRRAEGE